jgi:hypothetical protein
MKRDELLKKMAASKGPEPVELSFGTAYVVKLNREQLDHATTLATLFSRKPSADRASGMSWFIISNGWVDEEGNKILDQNSKEDRELFKTFDAGDSQLLSDAIMNISRVSKEDRDFLGLG